MWGAQNAVTHELDLRPALIGLLRALDEQAQFGTASWRLAFELARGCRLLDPAADPLDAVTALGTIDELDLPWWRLLRFDCPDDAQERFLHAWEEIRFLGGTLEEAVRHGLASPALLPRRLSLPKGLATLVAALAHVQRVSGRRPVVASQTAFAELMGIDQATVSRWIRRLRREGVLVLDTPYWHPRKRDARSEEVPERRAASYVVDLERVKALEAEATATVGDGAGAPPAPASQSSVDVTLEGVPSGRQAETRWP